MKLPNRHVDERELKVNFNECINFTYRNIMLKLSIEEFAFFITSFKKIFKSAEYVMHNYDYEMGDPDIDLEISYKTKLSAGCDINPNNIEITEDTEENAKVIKYRDIELKLSKEDYEILAQVIQEDLNGIK